MADKDRSSTTRVDRLVRAAGCSYEGLKLALLRERAFQEELLVLLVLVIPGAIVFGESGLERAVMIGSWGNVLVAEVLNTAVEVAVDRVSTEQHPLSREAKDLASGAVLVSIVVALAVWGLILFT